MNDYIIITNGGAILFCEKRDGVFHEHLGSPDEVKPNAIAETIPLAEAIDAYYDAQKGGGDGS